MATYAPLKFIENSTKFNSNNGFNGGELKPWSFLEVYCGHELDLSDDDVFKMALHPTFMTSDYETFYGFKNDIHKLLLEDRFFKVGLGVLNKSSYNSTKTFITDVKDFLTLQPMLNLWAANKQVFKFDKSFTEALFNTDKLKIYEDILEHIPYNVFYIDLSASCIKNVEGIFVHVYKNDGFYYICNYVLTSQLVVFSHYIYLNFALSEKDYIEIKKPNNVFYDNSFVYCGENEKEIRNVDYSDLNRVQLSMLVYQFLMYLGSKEPDIDESPISKSTYKPGTVIKNSFKEVRTWDVGIRYGKAFNIIKKQIEKENSSDSGQSSKSRKAPRPHMRCAHWQRFHTGVGRVNTELKWIPPVFVLGSGSEIPLTIHKVS